MSAKSTSCSSELNSSPSYLLASLFCARKAGDKVLERYHAEQLAKLGIKIQFASDIAPRKAPSQNRVARG